MFYSIVIPYYNSPLIEQLCIDLTNYFSSLRTAYEIIIVNDKSNLSRQSLLDTCEHNYPNVKLYNLEENFGQDYATGFGISKSSGKYIISIDDDLEFPVKEIDKLIAVTNESYDVIYGIPSKPKNSLFRKYTRIFYYFLVRLTGYNSFGSFRLLDVRLKEKITLHFQDKHFCIDKLLLKEAQKIINIDIINQPKDKTRYNKLKLFKKFLLFFVYRY